MLCRIVPAVVAQAFFTLAFLEELESRVKLKAIGKDIASTAAQRITKIMVRSFARHMWESYAKRKKSIPGHPSPNKVHNMALVIRVCICFGLDENFKSLIQTITDELPRTDSLWWHRILMANPEAQSYIILE